MSVQLVAEGKELITESEQGSVHQQVINGKLVYLTISHKLCEAKVSLFGGQVVSWQPNGHREVFWLSKKSAFDQSRPIRGGIPICWPWFGPLVNETSHGFARNSDWQLGDIQLNPDGVVVQLSLGKSTHPNWQGTFQLIQTLQFSDTFSQALTMKNLSAEAQNLSFALHSYFAVSDPELVTIPSLADSTYENKVSGLKQCQQVGQASGLGPVDNIYQNSKSATLIDKGWGRAIEINKSNANQWVLWNPGPETAAGMADVHQHGEQEFVCLEAANTQWFALDAGAEITASQEIKVYNL
ncbi:D-hexose-6-phosphate mutarotase [Thalassotalea sp. PS06]|uniref:D-hexose-6-phosphate mutarotase n=1 Tax=Thalassotalea sp. PS06 TaxID=2594005 RepID=UPI001163685A|nr:D-hexose-6-phosphate mutarotase [Thalassotalea sp. PS06]QDP02057.1 D-hexose-6-phosphate mutarotase [Thalassotalea sp. PS06]